MMIKLFALLLLGSQPLSAGVNVWQWGSNQVQDASQNLASHIGRTSEPLAENFSLTINKLINRSIEQAGNIDAFILRQLRFGNDDFNSLLRLEDVQELTDATAPATDLSLRTRSAAARLQVQTQLKTIRRPVRRKEFAAAEAIVRSIQLENEDKLSLRDLATMQAIRLSLLLRAAQTDSAQLAEAEAVADKLFENLRQLSGEDFSAPAIGTLEVLTQFCVLYNLREAPAEWFDQLIRLRREQRQPDLAAALANKGGHHLNRGEPELAKPLLHSALDLSLLRTPQNEADLALIRDSLASAYYQTKEYAKARPLLEANSAHYLANDASQYWLVSPSPLQLARTLIQLEDYPAAEAFLQQGIAATSELGDKAFRKRIELMDELALFYREQGHRQKAIDEFERILALEHEHRGKTHVDVAVTLNRIGVVHSRDGDAGQAAAYYEQALEIANQHPLGDFPYRLRIQSNLVFAYSQLKQWQEAEQLAQTALADAHSADDDTLSMQIELWVALSDIYSAQTLPEQARQALETALAAARSLDDKSQEASLLYRLGKFHFSQSDYLKASPAFLQALLIYERIEPQGSYDTILAQSHLGFCYYALSRTAEATVLHERAATAANEYLPKGDPTRVYVIYNFANLLLQEGQAARAHPYYREVLELIDGNPRLQNEYPYVGGVLHGLADASRELGIDETVRTSEKRIALLAADIVEEDTPTAQPAPLQERKETGTAPASEPLPVREAKPEPATLPKN